MVESDKGRVMATSKETGVIPIMVPHFAWTDFLKDVASLCGHSPICGVDSYPYKLKDYARLIAVFGEFRNGKSCDPKKTLRSSDDLLQLLHFGFVIHGSTGLIFRIMELTDLKIISAKMQGKGRAAIVTGTLKQWQDAVISGLSTTIPKNSELRWVFSQCLDFFEQLGLQDIWYDYRKRALQDQTYLLEAK